MYDQTIPLLLLERKRRQILYMLIKIKVRTNANGEAMKEIYICESNFKLGSSNLHMTYEVPSLF